MTRFRRRWGIIICKIPLILPLLIVAVVLEVVIKLSDFVYHLADKARYNLNEWWRSVERYLPDSFVRIK